MPQEGSAVTEIPMAANAAPTTYESRLPQAADRQKDNDKEILLCYLHILVWQQLLVYLL